MIAEFSRFAPGRKPGAFTRFVKLARFFGHPAASGRQTRRRRGFCDERRMCPVRKQSLNAAISILAAGFIFTAPAQAGETAGGIVIGDGVGGVTDRAYVTAPPNYLYVVEKERGSFLDCGEGQDVRATDNDGRDLATLRCGVTLTETIVIPAAAASARIIIHY